MFFIKNGEPIEEGYIFDSKDIKYRVDEFESGKVKTLLVTGQSGSGKSTVGHKYEKELGIPCYELDDIGYNWKFTDAQLTEYGKEMYDFFKGPGKKYRIDEEMMKKIDPTKEAPQDVMGWKLDVACADFIKYIISKKARCIVEGVNIFFALRSNYISPEMLKDCAVIIKGASGVKSMYRAWKRDFKGPFGTKDDPLTPKEAFEVFVARLKFMIDSENGLRKMRQQYR
jgi:hypothetical protein